MSRRAVRKIGAGLDLTRWLKTFEQLPRPWDDEALFGRRAPLEVELGSGKGLFMSSAAAGFPEHNYLGLEVAQKYARHAAARLARRELPNACMMHGDGLRVFRELLPDNSLAAVHVYFPDPWWKARHKKRRVMNPTFLADVQRSLQPGGTLHFWTDVEEYFTTSLAVIAESTTLLGPLPVAELPAQHDLDYRTHFERRMRLHGEPIYRSEFKKAAG
jgi:tRNA (guanine-N7-)-methyltransferase